MEKNFHNDNRAFHFNGQTRSRECGPTSYEKLDASALLRRQFSRTYGQNWNHTFLNSFFVDGYAIFRLAINLANSDKSSNFSGNLGVFTINATKASSRLLRDRDDLLKEIGATKIESRNTSANLLYYADTQIDLVAD